MKDNLEAIVTAKMNAAVVSALESTQKPCCNLCKHMLCLVNIGDGREVQGTCGIAGVPVEIDTVCDLFAWELNTGFAKQLCQEITWNIFKSETSYRKA